METVVLEWPKHSLLKYIQKHYVPLTSRNHEQTVLLKEIQRLKAALRHDKDEECVMIPQKRCLEEFDLKEEMLLSQGERAKLVRTKDWADLPSLCGES